VSAALRHQASGTRSVMADSDLKVSRAMRIRGVAIDSRCLDG
jgi:hypothetical protein